MMKTFFRILAVAITLVGCGSFGQAQTPAVWGGGSGVWDTTTSNWTVGGVAAAWPGSGGLAVFPTTANYTTITLDHSGAALPVFGLRFDDGGYTLARTAATDSFSLGAGGIVANAGTGDNTIENRLQLTTNASVTNNSGHYLELNGNIDLGANTLTFAGNSTTRIGATISGTGGVTVSNYITEFSATPAYTGATNISPGGTLWLDEGVALGETNLVFGGGLLVHAGGGTWSPSLGTGAGQVRVASDSGVGISAYQTPLTINFGGAGATLTNNATPNWLSGSTFDAHVLTLSSSLAQASTTLANPVFVQPEDYLVVNVYDNPDSAADYAYLAGGVKGSGELGKYGDGLLLVNAAASGSFSGKISLVGGTLAFTDGPIPGNATRFGFYGGAVHGYGTLPLANAAWDASKVAYIGAQGGALTVGGTGQTLNWTQSGAGGGPAAFALGNMDASSTLTVASNLNLGGNWREIYVLDGAENGSSGAVVLSGVISNGGLYKTGPGYLYASNLSNSYGNTFVAGGVLGFQDSSDGTTRSVSLTDRTLYLTGGGVLQHVGDDANDVVNWTFKTAYEAAGDSQISFTPTGASGGGGFAAKGGAFTVSVLGPGGSTPVWGATSNFLQNGDRLVLNSNYADTVVTYASAIDLGGGQRTIHVQDNPAVTTDRAAISGALSNGGVTKTGDGLLWMLSSQNNYAGATRLEGGVTRFGYTWTHSDYGGWPSYNYYGTDYGAAQTLPASSNLTFAGGVFEQAAGTYQYGYIPAGSGYSTSTGYFNFTRSLGAGAGQVQWVGDGGFSAYQGGLTVNIGGNSGTLTWGQGGFVPDGARLLFGSAYADSTVYFSNGIDLAGGNRTIHVTDNPDSAGDAVVLWGAISNGALTKTGDGKLSLQGSSTYAGGTTVAGGTLAVFNSSALGTGAVSLAAGATLQVGANLANTIDGGGHLEFLGGMIQGRGMFSRAVGTGDGEVSWAPGYSGGFSGVSAAQPLVVNLGGNGATLTWGAPPFLGTGSLLLGGNVTVQNPIDLGGNAHQVSASGLGNVLAGAVTNGTLSKSGSGTLTLSGNNSFSRLNIVQGGITAAADANLGGAGATVALYGDPYYNSVVSGYVWNGYTYVPYYNSVLAGYYGTSLTLTDAATFDKTLTASGAATIAASASGTTRFTGTLSHGGGQYTRLSLNGPSSGLLQFDSVSVNAPLTVTGRVRFAAGTVSDATTIFGTLMNSAALNGPITVYGVLDLETGYPTGSLALSNATLRHSGAGFTTASLPSVSGSPTFDSSGTGPMAFTNTNALSFAGSGARTLTLTGTNTGANRLAATIADNGGATSVVKSGSSVWKLGSGNTYTGATQIFGGTLVVDALADGGAASSLGASASSAANLVLNGGTLRYTGGAATTDRLFLIGTAGGTIESSGTGDLVFSSTGAMGFYGAGSRTLTLAGNSVFDTTLAAVIGDNGGATRVETGGTAWWTLSGANTYSGGTAISSGRLTATNGSALGTGTVTLASGTELNLRFSGELANAIVIADGAGTIRGNAPSLTGPISGSGGLRIMTDGVAALSGNNSYEGGTTIFGSTVHVGSHALGSNPTVAFEGGRLVLEGSLDGLRATVQGTATIDTNGYNLGNASIAPLNGSSTFHKSGAGTLELIEADFTGGRIYVDGGTLRTNAVLSGELVVGEGGTFAGNATVQDFATIERGGHLSPGNSLGTLTFANGLSLLDGAVLDFELGSTSDQIYVTGGAFDWSTEGTIMLNLSDAGDFNIALGHTYTLIDFTGATATCFDVGSFGFGTLLAGTTLADYTLGFSGSTLTLSYGAASAVPEPATWAAVAGAAMLACAMIRRRRSARADN